MLNWVKEGPREAVLCLTSEVLSNAQSQAIFGPLNNARIVEYNTGQDHPLAPHHRLVCWLLRESRCPNWWRKQRDKLWNYKIFLCVHSKENLK